MRIGDQTGQECINACKERRKNDATINGVTIRQDGTNGCWCEKKMTRFSTSTVYKTCFLEGYWFTTLAYYIHFLFPG